MRTIFSRLMNGESTAIVGEPHIGKSSLLGYVGDEEIRSEWLGASGSRFAVHHVDCHMASSELRPEEFWSQILSSIPVATLGRDVGDQLAKAAARNYASFDLFKLFSLIAANECRLIVLIDEFDTLLVHPKFAEAFFATLRSIATRSDGLCYITASRLTVAQMNRLGGEKLPLGSPLFNNVVEVRLTPLSSVEVRQLLDMSLAATEVRFDDADYEFIERISGKHPFLVQLAAASVFDAQTDTQQSSEKHQRASRLFAERAGAHYEHLWRTLTPSQRQVLRDVASRASPRVSRGASRGEHDSTSRSVEIRDLEEMGLIARCANATALAADIDNQWSPTSTGLEAWLGEHEMDREDDPTDRSVRGRDDLGSARLDEFAGSDLPADTALRNRLFKALLQAYPDRGDLNRLLWLNLGKSLNEIAGSQGNQTDAMLDVLVWAIGAGRVQELLRAAVDENPYRADLGALLEEVRQLNA